ncbi:phosphate transport system permease protein [Bacilli bacterium PM5-3]|nr:phosphate transport system permease protein [Bacilli bacterium PM5-3]MDH6603471.1 phosphate transport system permease protein [Bacilli bacterium PM5-9]
MLNKKGGIKFINFLMYLSIILLVAFIVLVIGFILIEGLKEMNINILFNSQALIISTLMLVGITLLIAVPLGIFSAIYLQMYAKQGKVVNLIRFSIDSLTGIPSIIYGLFALSFFVYFIGINRSILAGSLSLSIVVLPLLIKNTEEAIKTINRSQIEASLALGATKYITITRVVIPFCIDGIINGVVLAIGRIIGETAAIMFVIGSLNGMPSSPLDPGASLATHLYLIIQEPTYSSGGISDAYSLAFILLFVVIFLNIIVKLVDRYFKAKRGY